MITTKLTAIFVAAFASVVLSSCFMDLDDPSLSVPVEPFCGNRAFTDRTPLSSGGTATAVIRSDGSLWNWGALSSDQGRTGSAKPVQYGKSTGWASVSIWESLRIGIKRDGSLWSDFRFLQFGSREVGPLAPVTMDCDWANVSFSGGHVVATKTDGSLWAWGGNGNGQLGIGSTQDQSSPARVGTDSDWKEVSTAGDQTFAVKRNGTLWGWGTNYRSLLGPNQSNSFMTSYITEPHRVNTDRDWVYVSVGLNGVAAIKADESLWTDENSGSLTMLGVDHNWEFVAQGSNHLVATKTDGTLWGAGDNSYGQVGPSPAPTDTSDACRVYYNCRKLPVQIGTDSDWGSAAAGDNHSVAMKSDGRVFTFGSNEYGQLGNGTFGSSASRKDPVRVGDRNDWTTVVAQSYDHESSAGQYHPLYHVLALNQLGEIWTWGGNDDGQLGDGTTINRTVPTRIGAESDWSVISTGSRHSLAVKKDGSLWSWGKNNVGQLGTSDEVDHLSPIRVGTNAWRAIAAGEESSGGIQIDGSLWLWGSLAPSSSNKSTPQQIGTETDWEQLFLGQESALAIKTDGSLWAWGYNGYGQLGDGTTIYGNSYEPKQIGADRDWLMASISNNHTVAVKRDGTLWAWGQIKWEEIEPQRWRLASIMSPTQFDSGSDWVKPLPGSSGAFRAQRRDGSIWESDRRANKMLPLNVGTNWLELAGYDYDFTVGVKSDGSLWSVGRNYVGELGLGVSRMGQNLSVPTEVVLN